MLPKNVPIVRRRRKYVVEERNNASLMDVQRIWSSYWLLFFLAAITCYCGYKAFMWSTSPNDSVSEIFAQQEIIYTEKGKNLYCAALLDRDISRHPGCKSYVCGRYIKDSLIADEDLNLLMSMVKRAFKYGSSDGGASFFDLYSGVITRGPQFVNIVNLGNLFKSDETQAYRRVVKLIQKTIAEKFNILPNEISLTHPSFFSRFTNGEALVPHDIYWISRSDKLTYKTFHFTAVLYLSDFSKDFSGGQMKFVDRSNFTSILEPRKGRLLMFSSGLENSYYVEVVTKGFRYQLTMGFTCDSKYGIDIDDMLSNNFHYMHEDVIF